MAFYFNLFLKMHGKAVIVKSIRVKINNSSIKQSAEDAREPEEGLKFHSNG